MADPLSAAAIPLARAALDQALKARGRRSADDHANTLTRYRSAGRALELAVQYQEAADALKGHVADDQLVNFELRVLLLLSRAVFEQDAEQIESVVGPTGMRPTLESAGALVERFDRDLQELREHPVYGPIVATAITPAVLITFRSPREELERRLAELESEQRGEAGSDW